MTFHIEIDTETDGRWIAEIAELPGVMAYGATRDEAIRQVMALSLRVLAERVTDGTADCSLPIRYEFAA